MDLKDIFRAERLLDEISLSVKKIIFANFPRLSAEEKEEIDQEVKLKLLKMASRGKKIDNFKSYIWKMVFSTALDVISKRTPGFSMEDVSPDSGPPDTVRGAAPTGRRRSVLSYLDNLTPEFLYEVKELRGLALKAIDSLPGRRKSVLLLHIQGMDLEEIAAFLGETKPAVRHLLYRGIEGLREVMKHSASNLAPAGRRARVPSFPRNPRGS
jgi:RNA polymerase sigma factor (sigma-70 family)